MQDIVSSVLAASVQDAYASIHSQPKSLSPSWQLVSRTPTPPSTLSPSHTPHGPRGQKRTSEQKAHSFLQWQLSLLRAPFGSFLLFILIGRNFDTKQNSCIQHPTTQNSTMHFCQCFFKVDSYLSEKHSEFCQPRISYTHMHKPQLCSPE